MISFRGWLRAQRKRNDPVGDIARDVIQDGRERCLKSSTRSYRGIRRHMESVHSPVAEALTALEQAQREYGSATLLPGITTHDAELYRKARRQDVQFRLLEADMDHYAGPRLAEGADTIFNYRVEWMERIESLVGWERGKHWQWQTAADHYAYWGSEHPVPDHFSLGFPEMTPLSCTLADGTSRPVTEEERVMWRRCERRSQRARAYFKTAEEAAGAGWLFTSTAYDAITRYLDAYWWSLRERHLKRLA